MGSAILSEPTGWSIVLLKSLGALLVLGFLLYGLDRLLLWMECKGWIYWRKTEHRTGGDIGNALLEIQSLIDPGTRHVLEQQCQVKQESPEPGDPPTDEAPTIR